MIQQIIFITGQPLDTPTAPYVHSQSQQVIVLLSVKYQCEIYFKDFFNHKESSALLISEKTCHFILFTLNKRLHHQ